MEVQVVTRGYIPMINRRGPIQSITLDLDTINQLIADGVELCDPQTGDPIYKVWEEVPGEPTADTYDAASATRETVVTEPEEALHIGLPEMQGGPITMPNKEQVEEALNPVEEPDASEEDDTDKAEPVAGIPPYVPNPNLSKNQNKKLKREYYEKARAAQEKK